MQSQQLLTESQIFKDKVPSGTESTEKPSKIVSEQRDESQDHGQNLTETYRIRPDSKSFILQVHEVLTRDNPKQTYAAGLLQCRLQVFGILRGTPRARSGGVKPVHVKDTSAAADRAGWRDERKARASIWFGHG